MGKFRVLVECRNEGGTDLHCWIVEAKNPGEAEHIAVSMARAFYPEFDEFEPVRTEAVKMNRKGKGVELNPDYFRDGVGYLETADAERDAPTLFDLLENGA